MPWIWHWKISIVCMTDSAQQNASAAKLPRPSFPALLLFTVMKNLQQSSIFFKSTKFVWWSSFSSRTTSLLNNGTQFLKLFFQNSITGLSMQYTGTQKRLTAAAVDSAHHFLQHRLCSLLIFQVISLTTMHLQLCPCFYQRKVFYKIRSHTVTPCLVLDHQASAPGFCAVSTKTDLIMKSKGDSDDGLESTKLFLKQNTPWWTCDVKSGGLALGLFQMKCHLWTLHITELPGLKEVIQCQTQTEVRVMTSHIFWFMPIHCHLENLQEFQVYMECHARRTYTDELRERSWCLREVLK